MEGRSSLRRLLQAVGVDSIDRNLVSEDKAVWGEEGTSEDENEMRILAARDVTLHQAPNPAEASKAAPSLARKLLPLALGAGLGAGGLWLASNLDSLKWPEVPDTGYQVNFYNSDGELIKVPRHGE